MANVIIINLLPYGFHRETSTVIGGQADYYNCALIHYKLDNEQIENGKSL